MELMFFLIYNLFSCLFVFLLGEGAFCVLVF